MWVYRKSIQLLHHPKIIILFCMPKQQKSVRQRHTERHTDMMPYCAKSAFPDSISLCVCVCGCACTCIAYAAVHVPFHFEKNQKFLSFPRIFYFHPNIFIVVELLAFSFLSIITKQQMNEKRLMTKTTTKKKKTDQPTCGYNNAGCVCYECLTMFFIHKLFGAWLKSHTFRLIMRQFLAVYRESSATHLTNRENVYIFLSWPNGYITYIV